MKQLTLVVGMVLLAGTSLNSAEAKRGGGHRGDDRRGGRANDKFQGENRFAVCGNATTEEACDEYPRRCAWDEEECVPLPVTLCAKLNETVCGLYPRGPCSWDAEGEACVFAPCYENEDETDCEAQAGCKWLATGERCVRSFFDLGDHGDHNGTKPIFNFFNWTRHGGPGDHHGKGKLPPPPKKNGTDEGNEHPGDHDGNKGPSSFFPAGPGPRGGGNRGGGPGGRH